MADTIAVPIRRVARLLPDLVGELSGTFEEKDGMLHRKDCWQGRGGTRTEVPYLQIKQASTCDSCLRAYHLYQLPKGPFLDAVHDLTKALKPSRSVQSDLQVRNRIDGIQKAVKAVTRHAVPLSEKDQESLDGLLSQAAAEVGGLEGSLASPAARENALEEIRKDLLGGLDGILDETPTLQGIHPYREGDWARLRPFAVTDVVREDPLVLLVPRYVADWILDHRDRGGVHPALTAPSDETILREVVEAWDPTSTGLEGTLAGAHHAIVVKEGS